jgi:hypothetical protein
MAQKHIKTCCLQFFLILSRPGVEATDCKGLRVAENYRDNLDELKAKVKDSRKAIDIETRTIITRWPTWLYIIHLT